METRAQHVYRLYIQGPGIADGSDDNLMPNLIPTYHATSVQDILDLVHQDIGELVGMGVQVCCFEIDTEGELVYESECHLA